MSTAYSNLINKCSSPLNDFCREEKEVRLKRSGASCNVFDLLEEGVVEYIYKMKANVKQSPTSFNPISHPQSPVAKDGS